MTTTKKKVTKKKTAKKVTKKKVAKKTAVVPETIKEPEINNGRQSTDLKRLNAINKEQIQAMLSRYLDCSLKELMSLKKDPETSAMELIVIGIITKAIKDGDPKRLDFLFDRIVGKVKNELEVSGNVHDKLMDMIEKRTNR